MDLQREGFHAALRQGAGRWPGVDVLADMPPITSYPFVGSAIFYWDTGPVPGDSGVPPPPLEAAVIPFKTSHSA